MNCPECNSENLYKKGTRAGKKRYKCKECGRCFVEGTPFVGRQVKLPPPEVSCPHCNSSKVRRDGILETGGQRYKCLKCGKGFSSNTVVRPPVQYPCPYCGGKLRRSGHGKLGQPEYLCTVCGRSCSGDPPKAKAKAFKEVNTKVNCPYCNSRDIVLRGTHKGFRKYICHNCNKVFTDDTKERLKREHERARAMRGIKCPTCGHGGKRINSAGVNKYGLERFRCMKCKKSWTVYPELSASDKKLILMYRLNLKVSFPSIMRHFKCSKEMIEKIVKESGLVK